MIFPRRSPEQPALKKKKVLKKKKRIDEKQKKRLQKIPKARKPSAIPAWPPNQHQKRLTHSPEAANSNSKLASVRTVLAIVR